MNDQQFVTFQCGGKMKRRRFWTSLAVNATAVALPGSVLAMGEKRDMEQYGVSSGSQRFEKIGNRKLGEIREVFRHELEDITIPLWRKQGVDWEFGGYLPHLDESGNLLTTNKQLYYQGRVLWLFSYLYNNFGGDPYHLRAAENGYRFLKNHCVDDKYDWFTEVTRDGKPVTKFSDIYASIYMILGLGEYYRATGSEEACMMAVNTTCRVTEIVLSPHYQAHGHGPWYEPGTKRLGTWLHLLNAVTPLLKYTDDPGIEKIAKMCVRYMLNYHWRPDLGVAFETLQPDFNPYPDDLFVDDEERGYQNQARWVNNFHTMEASWMIMDEALRVGNTSMFMEGMKLGRVHLEKFWVRRGSEQGIIQFLRPDDPDPLKGRDICKPYVFREIFILLLLAIEHTREDWAFEWFDRVFSYAYEKPLEWPWMDTLHQPRGVIFCLEILDRMIARGGRASDFIGEG